MKTRTTLTKSLHTVTVVSRIAADLASRTAGKPADPVAMVYAALDFIGQGTGWATDDATVVACVKATEKLIAGGAK